MCEPTTALLIASAGSSFLQFQQAKAQQKAQYEAQKRQNELARANAIRRYATEQLKIRQEIKKSSAKGFEASLRSKKARARFIATELRFLATVMQPQRLQIAAAKQVAKDILAKKTLREVRPTLFARQEAKATKAAEKAMDPFMMPTPHLEEGRYFDENKVFTDLARDESRLSDYMTEREKIGQERMEKMQPVQFYTGARYGGLIGDKSGPAPTGGPMSQGLRSLYNNGRKL